MSIHKIDILELESSASRLKSRYNLTNEITYHTESTHFWVLFKNPPQSKLSIRCHFVCLVKNDEFDFLKSYLLSTEDDLFWIKEMLDIDAKFLISSRTTFMPLSSLALSSRTICLYWFPYSLRAQLTIVLVFPVPGGP